MMEDPEAFLAGLAGKRVVLDEIHRLAAPSELLKIGADHFPDVRLLATGSSTLGASAKFKDTLTGRKHDIWLTPMILEDMKAFGNEDLGHRLIHGGLPPFFLEPAPPERDFQEWIDSYWAKDIQELFRLERRSSFQRFLELVLAQSGGIFEASSMASPCEISRTTVANYLKVLEATSVSHVIRPFHKHRSSEIVSAPKVYGFDTGFVCCFRGIDRPNREDLGLLWEHFVLNEIQGRLQTKRIQYWRDKRRHEIDFVWAPGDRNAPVAIECKWSASGFQSANLRAFRHHHPEGPNYVVATDVDRPFAKRYGDLSVEFIGLRDLAGKLS